jgi:hypothetical protein
MPGSENIVGSGAGFGQDRPPDCDMVADLLD